VLLLSTIYLASGKVACAATWLACNPAHFSTVFHCLPGGLTGTWSRIDATLPRVEEKKWLVRGFWSAGIHRRFGRAKSGDESPHSKKPGPGFFSATASTEHVELLGK
jgi:hypothetical protein